MGAMDVRVFLIGHGMFRDAIRMLIHDWPHLELAGEASSWEVAAETMPPEVDAVIVDRNIPFSPAAWQVILKQSKQIFIGLDNTEMVVHETRAMPATPQMLSEVLKPRLSSPEVP